MIKHSLLLALLLTLSPGQVFTPPAQKSSEPASNTTTAPASNNSSSKGSPFGEEIPLLNPGDETITIGGLTIPLGDNRIIKARFEKYLNQPEEDTEAAAEYHETLDKIIGLLAPHPDNKTSRQAKIEEAFALLPLAAAYPGDAKICQTLAETIYSSLEAKKDVKQMSRLNDALEDKRASLARSADWERRHADTAGLSSATSAEAKEAKKVKAQAETSSSQKYIWMLKQIAEIEAMRKKHTLQSEKQILQTKIQFQASIMQWLMQRRFHHVIIGCRFYNVLWQDGDNALHMKKDATMSKLFSDSLGFSPTITALDSLANEAVRDTQNAISACKFLLEKEELHTATKRLLESFAVGEFLSPVATLDREKKRKIQVYSRELFHLYDALQARDFGRARELTVKLKEDAKDFPSSKAESAISGNVIASNMAVSKAQKALLEEDELKVAESIQRATELWPTNPKLMEFSEMLESGSTVNVLRNDFKRLLSEENYREIYKRQYEFAPVIQNSSEDLDAFNQIIGNLKDIETVLLTAENYVKNGNAYGAWEQLDGLREKFPDDPKLGREMEKLAPQVADFTKALDHAKNLEARTPAQTGSAISYYLKAKTIYPNSNYAQEGLERLINQAIGEE